MDYIYYFIHISNIDVKILGKLQSWFLFFTPYFNLIHSLSIVSIWPSIFSISCQFSPCRYLLDEKNWCVKWNNKKLFFILHANSSTMSDFKKKKIPKWIYLISLNSIPLSHSLMEPVICIFFFCFVPRFNQNFIKRK